MGFPGTWMTESESMIYRVVPKCACSTVGQAMYFSDHGHYYDGDIHDAKTGILKWAQPEAHDRISERARSQETFAFTTVRNPYSRILSAFFDKICGIQRNGNRYRGNLVPKLIETYGLEIEGDFDQIASFRRFLLFARDTIRFNRPMEPDIHWSAMSGHISTYIMNGGKYDYIFPTEDFKNGMTRVLQSVEIANPIDVGDMPRFNESAEHGPKMKHEPAEYFDDLSMHLVYEIYKRDFTLFNYSADDPNLKKPQGEIDLDKVHAVLGP